MRGLMRSASAKALYQLVGSFFAILSWTQLSPLFTFRLRAPYRIAHVCATSEARASEALRGFVEDKLFVNRVIHASEESAREYLRRKVPDVEPFDEDVQKARVEDDVRQGECGVHRELHVHAVGREILERPQFLQGKAENKRDARRDNRRIDVPHMQHAREKIEERQIHRRARPARNEVPHNPPLTKRQTIENCADTFHS